METLSHKNPSQKERVGGVAQGEGPEFKPQYHRKKKKKFQSWIMSQLSPNPTRTSLDFDRRRSPLPTGKCSKTPTGDQTLYLPCFSFTYTPMIKSIYKLGTARH
jgi:hypothetical protein